MTDFALAAFLGALPFTVLAVVVVLGATFLVALRLGRHAVVDVAWGLGFVAVAVAAFAARRRRRRRDPSAVSRSCSRSCGASGSRSTSRCASRGHGEDPRYAELLAKAPGNPQLYALRRIYLTQGVVIWFVSLPVQVAMFDPGRGQRWPTWLGVAVWAVGFVFETVGDLQLTRFRNDPSTSGQVLDTGLWRFTRHPNYFGDACVWWGLSLIAFSSWPGDPHAPLAAADDLAARQGHRQAAAGEGHGLAPARLRRVRPPHQRLRPAARPRRSDPHPEETPVKTLQEGTQAPDFELPDQDGTPVRLSERLADGPVVLFFYPAAMTGGCTKEACHFRDLATEFEDGRRPAARDQRRPGRQAEAVRRPARLRLPAALRRVRRRGHLVRRTPVVTPVKRATFVIDPTARCSR